MIVVEIYAKYPEPPEVESFDDITAAQKFLMVQRLRGVSGYRIYAVDLGTYIVTDRAKRFELPILEEWYDKSAYRGLKS